MKIKNSLLVRGSRPQLDCASATKKWHAEYCGSEMLLLVSISVLWNSYSNAKDQNRWSNFNWRTVFYL